MAIYPQPTPPGYDPTQEQLERERALRRFNRLYIYLPLGIMTVLVIGLLVLMLIGIFAPGLVGAEEFLSGLADTILVLWMIPMMVLFAVVPVAYVGYLVNRRQRRNMLPPDSPLLQHSRVQMAMWRAQNILDRVENKSEDISDRVAQPLIALNAKAAQFGAWFDMAGSALFGRDDYDDADGTDRTE